MSYREYFDIDPEYFPQVDKKIIEEQPDLWKKFYPHPTFIKLLKSMVDVLSRKQKLSVWVDGAYGTGKSHAVLTLKKLIEASDEETNAYFERYNLDNFLCQKLIAQKNEGKILVCHRYGSSDIQSDTDLVVAIQEGVEKALADAGIENVASTSLKNSLIRYFEDEENKMNLSLIDVEGSVLSISQFTLYANCKKGRRPSFVEAARPEVAKPLYEYFNSKIEAKGIKVEKGIFGAMMDVSLNNDGPVTIILDSKEIF